MCGLLEHVLVRDVTIHYTPVRELRIEPKGEEGQPIAWRL